MALDLKKGPLYLGIILVVALAGFILLNKFSFTKEYTIVDSYKIKSEKEAGAVYFVKVKEYDTQKLYDYSKEIASKYISDLGSLQNNSALIIQFYKEGSEKEIDDKSMKELQNQSPNLVPKAKDIRYIENGYIYRAFYSQGKDAIFSLIGSSIFIPKSGIKADELLNSK